jgi:hypothetical protein
VTFSSSDNMTLRSRLHRWSQVIEGKQARLVRDNKGNETRNKRMGPGRKKVSVGREHSLRNLY